MRYRDFAPHTTSILDEKPDNTVTLHVRRDEMSKLESLITGLDMSLNGPIRRMPTGGAFVEIVCPSAATAAALRAKWSTAL